MNAPRSLLLCGTLAAATCGDPDDDDRFPVGPGLTAGASATSGDSDSADGPEKLDLGGGMQATDANAEGESGNCGEVSVTVNPTVPTIMVVVDQSGSMEGDFSGVDKWSAVYDTLMNPTDGVVPSLDAIVRFGLTLYSSTGELPGGMCPLITVVPPALGNRAAIDAVYAPAVPIDETPTGESLSIIADTMAAFDEPGPKAIVLATDGEPDTCAQPNPEEGQPEALLAAQKAWGLGVDVYIISVGNDVSDQHLQDMANVGVGKPIGDPMPAPYYKAFDAGQLVAAFEDIIGTVVSCELSIMGEVELAQVCEGTVMLDGVELTCGEDWHMPDASTLELLGDACLTLKGGGIHAISATWPCGAVVIP